MRLLGPKMSSCGAGLSSVSIPISPTVKEVTARKLGPLNCKTLSQNKVVTWLALTGLPPTIECCLALLLKP